MLAIGSTVKEFRLLRGLSLNDVAIKTGLNKSYLSKIENEKRDPSLGSLSQISKAINVPLNILILMSEKESDGVFSEVTDVLKEIARNLVSEQVEI